MDSFVVLPASGASNGFSTPSTSVVFRPTSTSSDQSTFAFKGDVHAGRRSCSANPGSSSTGADRLVVSQSPAAAVVGQQQAAVDSSSMATTEGGRAQLISDRHRVAWDEMHERMERRRREWNAQVDRMRTDFFKLKPATSPAADDVGQSSTVITADRCQERVINVQPSWTPTTITRQQFQASFDLSEYTADEIRVQTDGRRLIVRATHQQSETNGKKTFSREFTRQIDIPRYVDASQLRCTLSDEGILHVEADAVACSSSSVPQSPAITDRSPQPSSALTAPRTSSQSSSTTSVLSTVPAVILQPDGTYMFRVSVSLGAQFDADQLTVKTIDRRLIVAAQRDETGPGRRAACLEFHHEFDLPESVDPEAVTAHVTDDGHLVVEAPCSTVHGPRHALPPAV